jgi:hypothetical protein
VAPLLFSLRGFGLFPAFDHVAAMLHYVLSYAFRVPGAVSAGQHVIAIPDSVMRQRAHAGPLRHFPLSQIRR